MKRRIVKVAGLLTVLMSIVAAVLLYVYWPYWHPMWWDQDPPERLRRFVETTTQSTIRAEANWLHRTINMEKPPGSVFDSIEILQWYEDEFGLWCIAFVSYSPSPTKVECMFKLETIHSDDDHWFAVLDKPPSVDELQSRLIGFKSSISPHVWKRVTGEVLTPSRLKELEAGPDWRADN